MSKFSRSTPETERTAEIFQLRFRVNVTFHGKKDRTYVNGNNYVNERKRSKYDDKCASRGLSDNIQPDLRCHDVRRAPHSTHYIMVQFVESNSNGDSKSSSREYNVDNTEELQNH